MAEPAFRLLVAGSGYWKDRLALWRELDEILFDVQAVLRRPFIVVHGASEAPAGYVGAEALAGRWALSMARRGYPTREEAHPADWHAACRASCRYGHRRVRQGERDSSCPEAGKYRNQEMIDLGADLFVPVLVPGIRAHNVEDCIERAINGRLIVRAPIVAARATSLTDPGRK